MMVVRRNTRLLSVSFLFVVVVGIMLLLSACGRAATPTAIPIPTPTATAVPTFTPTPTPTPDPVVARISDQVDVPAGAARIVYTQVEAGQRVEGTIAVRGGPNLDVGFTVQDPFGNVVVNAGRVSGNKGFAFVAATSGSYSLVFDNSYSLITSKAVDLVATVWRK